MKKVTDFLRPNLLIIFGAILLLYFLNWLSYGDAGYVATGVYAIMAGGCFLAIGILNIALGDKVNQMMRKIFEAVAIGLFGTLMFTYFLVITINMANAMGPTAWIIKILSMVASLGLVGLYIPAKFSNQKALVRFTFLASAVFALVLLLDLLFIPTGDAAQLDDIQIVLAAAYVLFVIYLFGSIEKESLVVYKEQPKQVEAPKEENKEAEE